MALDPSINKTGAAVPSDKPLDIQDDSLVFDTMINDTSGQTVLDRKGVERETYQSAINRINNDANEVIDSYRQRWIGDYTLPNKVFRGKGDFVTWAVGDGGDGNAYVYIGPESGLPYFTDVATYPDPNSDPNLQVNPTVTALYVNQVGTGNLSQGAGGDIWPIEYDISAQDGDDLTGYNYVRLSGGDFVSVTLFKMLKSNGVDSFSGNISNINLTTTPYTCTIGSDSVTLIEKRDYDVAQIFGVGFDGIGVIKIGEDLSGAKLWVYQSAEGASRYWWALDSNQETGIISSIVTPFNGVVFTDADANRYELAPLRAGQIVGDENKNYQLISCVIRNDGSGWEFIDFDNHNTTGVQSLEVTPGEDLQINYNFTAKNVSSIVVVQDETFAAEGIIAGPSVGLQNMTITFSGVPFATLDMDTLAITTASYWADQFALSLDTDFIEISTPRTRLGMFPSLQPLGNNPTEVRWSISGGSQTFNAYPEFDSGTLIEYNSGTGQYDVSLTNIDASKISVTKSANQITITHPFGDTWHTPSLTAYDGVLAGLVSFSSTTTVAAFRDYSGAASTDNPANRVGFNRKSLRGISSSQRNTSLGIVSYHHGGFAKINASSLSSGGGNFWIFGVAEI